MKILLTGRSGQVGWELQRALSPHGEIIAPSSAEMNLSDPDAIVKMVRAVKPDLIVNPAAYTAVDKAESEPVLARAINAIAPGILAEEAKKLGAALVHYSTDYVFDGAGDGFYTEDDVPNPLGVYGRTKLEGERAVQAVGLPHCILRTSWVYGQRGRNFVLTMLRLLQEKESVRVVADQYGAPAWSRWLAEASAHILSVRHPQELPMGTDGLYHLTPAGQVSWYGLACEIKAVMDCPAEVLAIASSEYPTPARRPLNSRLSGQRVEKDFGLYRADWQALLALCLADCAG